VNDLQNLHTHSVYCDGKNTLEEMIYNFTIEYSRNRISRHET